VSDRYEIFGELGKGGMGEVHRARDPQLGRDLAFKVLLEEHQDHPALRDRFVEEAQIGGQLQHPGIVPVYELGQLDDRRPYFTMKLVEGRTLADLLAEREAFSPREKVAEGPMREDNHPAPTASAAHDAPSNAPPGHLLPGGEGRSHDLPRFLSIFEAICQTVAYAHARGVIHRDLKPANVMVGAFGEVQVMDWGLAKILRKNGEATASAQTDALLATIRSWVDRDHSRPGSILGTPGYMPPEQARGEPVDERADGFALGAILCKILTGKTPYQARTESSLRAWGRNPDLGEAVARLDACGADPELIALTRDCLALDKENRPANARVVAERVAAYQVGVQEKLRAAELGRAEERARAEEATKTANAAEARAQAERKARHLQLGLAAAVLACTVAGGLGTTYYLQQESARTAMLDRQLAQVETLLSEARKQAESIPRWETALAALGQVQADRRSASRLAALQKESEKGVHAARRDQKLLDAVAYVRSRKFEMSSAMVDSAYARAFREAGIEPESQSAEEISESLKARPPSSSLMIAAALDEWTWALISSGANVERWQRQLEAARAFDPDTFRGRIRTTLLILDLDQRQSALEQLATEANTKDLPVSTIVLLAMSLADHERAVAVLRSSAEKHPDDLWVNLLLSKRLGELRPAPREEQLRYLMAARAIRPETAGLLARLLEDMGQTEEALAAFAELVARRPDYPEYLADYAETLKRHERPEFSEVMERAIAVAKAAVKREPDSEKTHFDLSTAFFIGGNFDGAIAELSEIVRIEPDNAIARSNLATALVMRGKIDEGIAEYRKAIRILPYVAEVHSQLGYALEEKGELEDSIAEYQKAIRISPGLAQAHSGLGSCLSKKGKIDLAIAEYRETIRIKPYDILSHLSLGGELEKIGQIDEAVNEYRKVVRIRTDASFYHRVLGNALLKNGQLDEAVAEYREAILVKPDDAFAHLDLGNAHEKLSQLDLAIADYREAVRIEPGFALAHRFLGAALVELGEPESGFAEFREAIKITPDNATAHLDFGLALSKNGKHEEAIAQYLEAVRIKPDDATAHVDFGLALSKNGQHDDAIAQYREAIQIKPDEALAYFHLGTALSDKDLFDEAIVAYREAIRIKPDSAEAHNRLGNALDQMGMQEDAIAEYRKAILIKPDHVEARVNLGLKFLMHRKFEEAIAICREAVLIKPDYPAALYTLGASLRFNGDLAEAVEPLRRAHELGSPPSERLLADTERKLRLAERLSAVTKGQDRPKDNADRLALADVGRITKHYASAARLWDEAFEHDPKLVDNRRLRLRYDAACTAALAAAGKGVDDPPPDDAERQRLRERALQWLHAELESWVKVWESGEPNDRELVNKSLERWRSNPELASVRDSAALDPLPERERAAWRILWADVDALLARIAPAP
jgi:serine/threonine-protein kinase